MHFIKTSLVIWNRFVNVTINEFVRITFFACKQLLSFFPFSHHIQFIISIGMLNAFINVSAEKTETINDLFINNWILAEVLSLQSLQYLPIHT